MVNRSRAWEKQHKLVCLDESLYKEISVKKGKKQTYSQFIKSLMGIMLIFSLFICAVGAADLKAGLTETTKTSVNLTEGKMTYTDKVSGISVTTATKIDGVDLKATPAEVDKGDYTFSDDKGIATFTYEYKDNKIKETIVLKEDKLLTFPVVLAPNTKVIEWGGTWKIVSTDGDESYGLIADVPYGIDAAGHNILMKYSFKNGELVLEYNRNLKIYNDDLTKKTNEIQWTNGTATNGTVYNYTYLVPQYDYSDIIYPLTIDPAWGTFGVASFTSNVTSSVTFPFAVQFNDTSTTTPTGWAWFFGDENYTQPWITTNTSGGWFGRTQFGSAAMPDGSFIIAGGGGSAYVNDTRRTTNGGNTWTLQNASSGWEGRSYLSMASLPDGSLIVTGGNAGSTNWNDTWRSTNNGATWTLQNVSSGWQPRYGQSTIGQNNGSIILIGGRDPSGYYNETWRSLDNGAKWTRVNASSGWFARYRSSLVNMPDGSLVLMGGGTASQQYNDTWRSTNNGTTWTLQNASSGWLPRQGLSSVAMPDGSILLLGGINFSSTTYYNDMWRSTDLGVTWTRVNSTITMNGYTRRVDAGMGALANGTVIVTSGLINTLSYSNDSNLFTPVGSATQNASHVYSILTSSSKYNVSLQAYKSTGFNNTLKAEYIAVIPLANFTSNVTNGTIPWAVQFNDTSTNAPVTWQWTFGDGVGTSTLQNPVYTYTTVGNFNVTLISNNSVITNTTTKNYYINTTGGTPYAEFTANTTTGVNPLTVHFTDQTNSSATAWNWTFGMGGAGNYSNSQNPDKTFSGVGRYNVTLNASSATSSNITLKAYYINVTAALTNPTGYLNITPSPMTMYATLNDTMQLNARNITAKFIYANVSFNKTYVTAISAANNFSSYPGLSVTSTINNASSQGFMYMNISKVDGSNIVIGSTLTPIVDMRFGVLNITNGTAPINFNAASAYLTTLDMEAINTTVPGVITTSDPYFTFNVRLINSATSTTVNTLATINTSGTNVTPLYAQTSTGYVTFSANYSNVRFNVTCDGYYPLSQTVLISNNNQIDLRLTPLSGPAQNTWYSPHQVRMLVIDDRYGSRMVGMTINITPITNTFPIGAQSDYLVNIYGVNPSAANDMMNGTLIMSGISKGDGSATFTMLSSIGYNVNIINTTLGINSNVEIYPIENDYNVHVSTSSVATSTSIVMNQTQLTYTAPNASYGTFGLTYQDISGDTTNVNFSVFCVGNHTMMYATDLSGFGSSTVYANYTLKAVRGEQYVWSYNATRVV